jgi:hypothetical protein
VLDRFHDLFLKALEIGRQLPQTQRAHNTDGGCRLVTY